MQDRLALNKNWISDFSEQASIDKKIFSIIRKLSSFIVKKRGLREFSEKESGVYPIELYLNNRLKEIFQHESEWVKEQNLAHPATEYGDYEWTGNIQNLLEIIYPREDAYIDSFSSSIDNSSLSIDGNDELFERIERYLNYPEIQCNYFSKILIEQFIEDKLRIVRRLNRKTKRGMLNLIANAFFSFIEILVVIILFINVSIIYQFIIIAIIAFFVIKDRYLQFKKTEKLEEMGTLVSCLAEDIYKIDNFKFVLPTELKNRIRKLEKYFEFPLIIYSLVDTIHSEKQNYILKRN